MSIGKKLKNKWKLTLQRSTVELCLMSNSSSSGIFQITRYSVSYCGLSICVENSSEKVWKLHHFRYNKENNFLLTLVTQTISQNGVNMKTGLKFEEEVYSFPLIFWRSSSASSTTYNEVRSSPLWMHWRELESHLQLFGRQSGVALLIPACDLRPVFPFEPNIWEKRLSHTNSLLSHKCGLSKLEDYSLLIGLINGKWSIRH